jgi:hypothetical protein
MSTAAIPSIQVRPRAKSRTADALRSSMIHKRRTGKVSLMVNELQARLHSLYNARVQLAQVGPQMAGLERYRIIASGEQLYTLLEAADRIAELEAALRHVRMILKSDSIEYDDMRGMDSIIDAALARQEHGLQLDREGEHDN